jgi:hypothetical protein
MKLIFIIKLNMDGANKGDVASSCEGLLRGLDSGLVGMSKEFVIVTLHCRIVLCY